MDSCSESSMAGLLMGVTLEWALMKLQVCVHGCLWSSIAFLSNHVITSKRFKIYGRLQKHSHRRSHEHPYSSPHGHAMGFGCQTCSDLHYKVDHICDTLSTCLISKWKWLWTPCTTLLLLQFDDLTSGHPSSKAWARTLPISLGNGHCGGYRDRNWAEVGVVLELKL